VQFEIGTPIDRAVTMFATRSPKFAMICRRDTRTAGDASQHRRRRIRLLCGDYDELDPAQLSWFIDNTVTKRLLAIPGVAQVSRSGGVDREIRVELDPGRLQALRLTAVEVNEQLRALNMDAAGGRAQVGRRRTGDPRAGRARTAEALGDTQVIVPGGKSVRLREIADVHDGIAEVRTIARLNGRSANHFRRVQSQGRLGCHRGERGQHPSWTRSGPRIPRSA